jgi:hypothetical protein
MKRGLLLITAIVFTILSANAQLPINQDFESGSLTSGGWTHVTVTGTMNWVIDGIHGVDGSKCGKVTGYTGVTGVYEINESWYVSPAINADAYSSIFLNFYSALGYTGDAMTAWYSSDYTGNPSTATWTEITGINWATNTIYWVWTPSGTINLSAMTGTSVYIAFKYVNSTTTGSNTWELDNIHIGETSGISQIVNTLSIYPNPVKTELNINSASKIASVTVSNLIGQTVMNVNNVNNSTYKFNVKGLANGVYLLNINNIDGARSISKFIKE